MDAVDSKAILAEVTGRFAPIGHAYDKPMGDEAVCGI